ncbi:MAG: imidazolonepropionase [Hyphomicrobiaceae bacterium]
MVGSVLYDGRLATMVPGASPYGRIDDGAIATKEGRIVWVGAARELPSDYAGWPREGLDGRLVTPGLVDCHTHLVYGGNRAREFELRLEGATYEEIARAGGGIRATVAATRGASEDQLFDNALPRLDAMIAEGATTVEIKSGYGLDCDTELKMLRVARRLGRERPVDVCTSFLGAHAIPEEFEGRADDYIDSICNPTLAQAATLKLVDAVDGFCETIAFAPEQIARVFDAAKTLALPVKLHAEQLTNQGGAALAASCGALSADHLEFLDDDGVAAMAAAGTVAVLLPGAYYTLRDTQLPPVDALRRAGVPIAIATDCNPGSSPLTSPLLTLNMACTLFRLTPQEALSGITREAARALGRSDDIGTNEPGKRADLAIWDVAEPAELAYRIGFNPLHRRLYGGTTCRQ